MKTLCKMAALSFAATMIVFASCDKQPEYKVEIRVESVGLDKPSATLTVGGEPLQLEATILPATATDKGVKWSSDKESVAEVDEEGLVTAIAEGTAKITVTTDDGGKTAECEITVNPAGPEPIRVTGVTLNHDFRSMLVTDEFTLEATVEPSDATDSSVTWDTSDETVVTVDSEGNITPVAIGEATITVITNDGKLEAECNISVNVLGEATFRTEKIWEVNWDAIPANDYHEAIEAGSQQWSDVVMVSGARGKTTYDGGTASGFKADVRENEGYGDLLSWAAVDTYADVICPDDWRVPTTEEYITLAYAFGAQGAGMEMDATMLGKFFDADVWNAELAGQCKATGELEQQGVLGIYWTSSEADSGNAYNFYFMMNMLLYPQYFAEKAIGSPVRCVK